MAGKLYKGDQGTFILWDTEDDLTGSRNQKFKVRKPSGAVAEWGPATVYSMNGKKQYLYYEVQAGDFNEVGEYKIQAYAELPQDGGTWWEGLAETNVFIVNDVYQ